MTMYATLEEAIDAAREEFLADNPGIDAEDANVQQFNAQKYVLQDGDIMWQVEFFAAGHSSVRAGQLCADGNL